MIGALVLGAGLTAIISVVMWLVWRRESLHHVFAGLPPGGLPVPGQQVAIARVRTVDAPVRTTPPQGFQVAAVGAVVDGRVDMSDVTATIMDLAARGHLQIGPAQPDGNVQLIRTGSTAPLWPWEELLLKGLFGANSSTEAQQWGLNYGDEVVAFRVMMWKEVEKLGWYRPNAAASSRVGWVVIAALGVAASGALLLLGFQRSEPYLIAVAVAILVASIWSFRLFRTAPGRTAIGNAFYAQAQGFKKYLETVDTDQIRPELGRDIFSGYLPYAIAFGCTDHWFSVVNDAAARGLNVPRPVWYLGDPPGTSISAVLDGIRSAITSITEASQKAQDISFAAAGEDGAWDSSDFGAKA